MRHSRVCPSKFSDCLKNAASAAHVPDNVQINYSASTLTYNVAKDDLSCNVIKHVTRIAIKCRF